VEADRPIGFLTTGAGHAPTKGTERMNTTKMVREFKWLAERALDALRAEVKP